MRKYASFATTVLDTALGSAPFAKTGHRHVFDYVPEEGYLYVRSRMISSRCNDNYDEFPAAEIKKAWRTFIGKPVFVNHHNEDIRRMRGVIIDAALHEDTNPDGSPDIWVEGLMEVDAVRYPKLAEAILAGEVDRTSMGCDVDFSVCSACGNKAATPLEYCAHIPKSKGMKYRRFNAATGGHEEVLVREICYGLRFFENSILVEDPADPTAFFLGVDDRGVGGGYKGSLPKAASAPEKPMAKVASAADEGEIECEDGPLTNHVKKRPGWVVDWHGDRAQLEYGSTIVYITEGLGGWRGDVVSSGQRFSLPAAGVWKTPKAAMDAAERYMDKYHPQWRSGADVPQQIYYTGDSDAYWGRRPVAMRRQGFGEQKAPTKVDTLRDEKCPVCGDADGYTGSRCMVCNYVKPPDPFMDPDLSMAQQVDLREQQDTGVTQLAPEAEPTLLSCDNCATQFQHDGGQDLAGADPNNPAPGGAPASKGLSPGPTEKMAPVPQTVPAKPPSDPAGARSHPNDDFGGKGDDAAKADEGKIPVEVRDGTPSKKIDDGQAAPGGADKETGTVPKEHASDTAVPTEDPKARPAKPEDGDKPPFGKKDDADPTAPEDTKKPEDATPPAAPPDGAKEGDEPPLPKAKAGDACPTCGKGTLQPQAQDDAGDPDAENAPDGKDGKDDNKPPFMKGDTDKDAKDDEEDSSGDPVDSEESPQKSQKPKKTTRSMLMRPALQAIAELELRATVQGQQLMTQQEQINMISRLAGCDREAAAIQARGAHRLAALRRRADAENPAQPVPAPGSEAPFATTQEAISPISPASPAGGSLGNDVTTPGSTSETDVAPGAQVNLLDPVAASRKAVLGYREHAVLRIMRASGLGRKEAEAILDDPLTLSDQDVTKPVAGTEGPRPTNEVRIETDIVAPPPSDGSSDINAAQGIPGPDATPPQKVGGSVTVQERTFAAMHLAKLRIAAGTAEMRDELALGERIAKSPMSNEAMVTEISTLDGVIKAAGRQQQQQQPVPRNVVPRMATKSTPSMSHMATAEEGNFTVPQPMVTTAVTSDELLFETA